MGKPRPDPAVVGFLSSRLYLAADRAGVDRQKVDRRVEYLLHADPDARRELERLIARAVGEPTPVD